RCAILHDQGHTASEARRRLNRAAPETPIAHEAVLAASYLFAIYRASGCRIVPPAYAGSAFRGGHTSAALVTQRTLSSSLRSEQSAARASVRTAKSLSTWWCQGPGISWAREHPVTRLPEDCRSVGISGGGLE